MDKEDLKNIPVEIIIPLLEAAPFVYKLVTEFMAMVESTREQIDTWGEKSEAEKKAALEQVSAGFDRSMARFTEALAAVKAKA